MRRVETSININKEGRSDHNRRRYVHHSVKKMLDSAATQEGLRLGELFGYFGHTARSLSGKMKPAEQEKIAKLKAQFNPANTEISIRKLIFLARNNADEHAKQRLMPIVRDLIQTVVIGKTPGHQPASLQVHCSIANIMASMEVLDLMEQQFITAAQNDLMARIASGEIDTEQKQKKLLDAYAEELRCKYPEWENLQVSVVAGEGFNHYLLPPQPRSDIVKFLAIDNRGGLFRTTA